MKTYLTLSTLFIFPIFSQVIKTSDYVRFINRNAGQKILFVNDTEGKAYCSGPGCDCAIRFDYKTISPGRIQMEFRKEADYGDGTYCVGHFGSKTNQCIVVVAENEPLYKNQLQCEETTYWNVNSTPVNTSVDIAGQSVVYLGDVEGIVTDAVKTRIAPDSTAILIDIVLFVEGDFKRESYAIRNEMISG